MHLLSDYSKLVLKGKLVTYRGIVSDYLTTSFHRAGGPSICKFSDYSHIERVSLSQRVKSLLITRENTLSFVKKIHKKNHNFALPYDVIKEFDVKGFEASKSNIRFIGRVFLISTFRIAKALIQLFKVSRNYESSIFSRSIYIFHITKGTLLKGNLGGKNLEYWLRENYITADTVIYHSNREEAVSNSMTSSYINTFLPKVSFHFKLLLVFLFIIRLFQAFLLLLLGRWQRLFMLDDWIYSQVFKWAKTDQIFKKYIFPFQGDQYRPCWSWIAEARGASIVQLNYAANIVPSLDMKYADNDNLNISTWSEIIPFSNKFVKTIEAQINYKAYSTKVISAGPVLYTDDPDKTFSKPDKPMLAIFDVAPLSQEKYIGVTEINDYMITDNLDQIFANRKFIMDCIDLAESTECSLVTKPKRYDQRIHPAYQELLENLQKQGKLTCLDPSIAPSRLVEASIATIALPFTTVGYHIEQNSNICFYDPIGKLACTHEAAFGIPLFTSKKLVKSWLTNLIRSK